MGSGIFGLNTPQEEQALYNTNLLNPPFAGQPQGTDAIGSGLGNYNSFAQSMGLGALPSSPPSSEWGFNPDMSQAQLPPNAPDTGPNLGYVNMNMFGNTNPAVDAASGVAAGSSLLDPSTTTQSDPWSTLRIGSGGALPPRPGMITSSPARRVGQALQQQAAPPQPQLSYGQTPNQFGMIIDPSGSGRWVPAGSSGENFAVASARGNGAVGGSAPPSASFIAWRNARLGITPPASTPPLNRTTLPISGGLGALSSTQKTG